MKLYKNKIFLLLSILILFSCNGKGQVDFYNKNYEFINLTKKKGKLVIYKPCDSNVEVIVVKNDSLFITTHQDGIYQKKIIKREKLNKEEFLIIYSLTEDTNDTLHLKKKEQIWHIDWGLYSEKELSQNYKQIEQPCIECFSKEECEEVIKKNNTIENKNSKATIKSDSYDLNEAVLFVNNKWNGTYYFENIDKQLDYIIAIDDNKLELSVEGSYHGYSDQLRAIQVGDTLGLFHHRHISGANYDDNRKYDLLKFYKGSDGKFYFEGNLPYLPKGAIQFDKVK